MGRRLHLLLSPLKERHDLLAQDWITYARRKCSWKPDWVNLRVSVHDWRAVWSVAKTLLHCTCKLRVFGLLPGTAKANINHMDQPKCELCGSDEAGQRHLALRCSKTQELRQLPKFRVLPKIHPFTVCTGIPCRTEAWSPWQVPDLVIPQVSLSGHAIFFTDGSASPPEDPGVRTSTWSVVHAQAESTFHKVAAGLTPGLDHTIARAETFAVLQAIQISASCDLRVGNQGVFLNLNRICSRPRGAVKAIKVKSHRSPGDAKDPFDLWTIIGNDHADRVAKDEMFTQIRLNQWSTTPYKDYDQCIKDAVLGSEYLHEVSKMVFKERKPADRPGTRNVVVVEDTPSVDIRYVSLPQQPSLIPESTMWDPKWLQLVVHYFSLLPWTDPEQVPQATPTPTALLELMIDCFISFQILPPVNLRLQKQRRTASQPVDWNKYQTQYFLFSRAKNNTFPKPYLTDGSYIWIRSLDFLKPHFHLFPGVRISRNTLKTFGFGNNVPSIANRPQLLCGHLVSQLLHNTLVYGVDRLRYPLVLPYADPRPLPSLLPADFNL